MEEVGGEDGEFEREREGGWEGVDFVPRKVLLQAMLAEGSLVDDRAFLSKHITFIGGFYFHIYICPSHFKAMFCFLVS